MNKFIFEKYNHLTVCYDTHWINSVKLMVKEHYDTEEYDNTIIFLNAIIRPNDPFYNDVKNNFNRCIYYNLNHAIDNSYYYDSGWIYDDLKYIENLKNLGVSEMWTMDYRPQLAIECEQRLGMCIKYKPMRYTILIKPIENIHTTPKIFDFCLGGAISTSETRMKFLNEHEVTNPFSLKIFLGFDGFENIIPELNSCKYIIDVPRLEQQYTQNQVRIFELLCMGYTVCSQKCKFNAFPGLVYEWENIDDLVEIVKKGEYLHPTEAYREMTYTDEAYEQYVNKLIELQTNVS